MMIGQKDRRQTRKRCVRYDNVKEMYEEEKRLDKTEKILVDGSGMVRKR